MIDWDQLAQQDYGQNFHDLSSFAQAALTTKYSERITIGPKEVDLVRALAVANEKIAKLQRDNRDLWHDNEELEIENLELRNELENRFGRGTRNR